MEKKTKNPKRFLIKWVSILCAAALLLASINIVCFGTVIGNILDRWQSGTALDPALFAESEKVANDIQEEGIVVLNTTTSTL